jgi:hypothetical protein
MRHQGSDKDPSRVSVALSLSWSSPHRVEFIAPALRLGDCLLFLTVHPVPVLTLIIYHSALFIYSIKIVKPPPGHRVWRRLGPSNPLGQAPDLLDPVETGGVR